MTLSKVLIAAALAVGAVTVAQPATANAEVSARCWAHLAEIPASQKTSAAGDVRYHRARGEFSPCTEQEASEADRSSWGSSSSDDNRDNSRHDDGKSRYCKKRWFC